LSHSTHEGKDGFWGYDAGRVAAVPPSLPCSILVAIALPCICDLVMVLCLNTHTTTSKGTTQQQQHPHRHASPQSQSARPPATGTTPALRLRDGRAAASSRRAATSPTLQRGTQLLSPTPHLPRPHRHRPYAALYTFNLANQQWEKVGIEGTLFLCQLTPSPIGAERYCAVILNRRGLDNFYIDLTSSEDMEITDPYVILQGDLVYGIWIFADPPPASTANCRVETAEKMMAIADRAKASREAKERAGKSGVREATEQTEAASSAPMGRQLSLRELFGQQREQDAGFSVHNHNSHPPPHMYQQQQAYMPPPNPGPAQQDVLGQLFMKAKQDYNGFG
jgi:hypothetical protein